MQPLLLATIIDNNTGTLFIHTNNLNLQKTFIYPNDKPRTLNKLRPAYKTIEIAPIQSALRKVP